MGTLFPVAALHAEQQGIAADEDRTLCARGLSIAASVSRFELTASELALVERGFAEGLLRMRVGSAQHPACPPERDFLPLGVQTGSTLIHDIELLEVLEPTQGGLQ